MRAEGAHSLLAVQKLQSSQVSTWFADEVHDIATRWLGRRSSWKPSGALHGRASGARSRRRCTGAARTVPARPRDRVASPCSTPRLSGVVAVVRGSRTCGARPSAHSEDRRGSPTRALRDATGGVLRGVPRAPAAPRSWTSSRRFATSLPRRTRVIGVVVVHVERRRSAVPALSGLAAVAPRPARACSPRCRTGASSRSTRSRCGDRPPLVLLESRPRTPTCLWPWRCAGRSGIVEGVDYRGAARARRRRQGAGHALVSRRQAGPRGHRPADRRSRLGHGGVGRRHHPACRRGPAPLPGAGRETRTLRALVGPRAREEPRGGAVLRR